MVARVYSLAEARQKRASAERAAWCERNRAEFIRAALAAARLSIPTKEHTV